MDLSSKASEVCGPGPDFGATWCVAGRLRSRPFAGALFAPVPESFAVSTSSTGTAHATSAVSARNITSSSMNFPRRPPPAVIVSVAVRSKISSGAPPLAK